MITLKIKITKEILKQSMNCGYTPETEGSKNIGNNCAVSLAIKYIFPNAYVGGHAIFFSQNIFNCTMALLPKNVTEFIQTFDRSSPYGRMIITPIEFEIQIPDEVISQINIDEIRPLLVNHPTLELT